MSSRTSTKKKRALLSDSDSARVRHSPRLASKAAKELKGTPPRPRLSPGLQENRILLATRNLKNNFETPNMSPDAFDRTRGFSTGKLKMIDAFSDDEDEDDAVKLSRPSGSREFSDHVRFKLIAWIESLKVSMQNLARSTEKRDLWKTPCILLIFTIFLIFVLLWVDRVNDVRLAMLSVPEFIMQGGLYVRNVANTVNGDGVNVDRLVDALIDNPRFKTVIEGSNEKTVALIHDYEKAVVGKMERLTSVESEKRNALIADMEKLRDEFRNELGELLEKKVDDVKLEVDERSEKFQKRLVELQMEMDATRGRMEGLKISSVSGSGDPEKANLLQIQVNQLEGQLKRLGSDVKAVTESLRRFKNNNEITEKKVREEIIESLTKAANGELDGKHPNLDEAVRNLKRSSLSEKEFMALAERLKSDLVEEVKKEVLDPKVVNRQLENVVKAENLRISKNQKLEFNREDLEAIVNDKLGVYDADKTGQFDFALESAGGLIESTRCTQTYDKASASYSVMGINVWSKTTDPGMILRPGTHPGQCWAFKGHEGRVVIRLSNKIRVQAVAIEHIPAILSLDGHISSAPKAFELRGLTAVDDPNPVLLGNFTYLDNNQPIQTFPAVDAGNFFDLVEVAVLSNHGNPSYTCIYRVRIHGSLE